MLIFKTKELKTKERKSLLSLGGIAYRKELEDTYDEWKLNLKKSVKKMRVLGTNHLKVDIDMGELLTWCAVRGCKNIGENRAEFITGLLRQGRGTKIEEQDLE